MVGAPKYPVAVVELRHTADLAAVDARPGKMFKQYKITKLARIG